MSERYPGGILSKTAPVTTGGTSGAGSAVGIWTMEQQAAAAKAGNWPQAGAYIEDVFSTYLYTGNGSTQTITNGIDLAGKGGLVWMKARNGGSIPNYLIDTSAYLVLNSNSANAGGSGYYPTYFNPTSSGFFIDESAGWYVNTASTNFVSWTFRKQPKFFDVVTWTGNGVSGRTVAHSLGSAPGCVIIKSTSDAFDWYVYHQSLGAGNFLNLNLTAAATASEAMFGPGNPAPSSTVITLGNSNATNGNGKTYVAYLFAHNAGGFGESGTDNVISCGSFTTDGSGIATVNLGYEPQWVMFKASSAVSQWPILDSMRGWTNPANNARLFANLSNAETSGDGQLYPTATGFASPNGGLAASTTYIYIAIRRGPMKTPTSGTSVFEPAYGTGGTPGYVSSFTVDSLLNFYLIGTTGNPNLASRLTGENYIATSSAAVEQIGSGYWKWDFQTGCNTSTFDSGFVGEMLRRAPGFFDVVCYTGNATAGRQLPHNLGVVPEFIITKNRGTTSTNWVCYHQSLGPTQYINLNETNGSAPYSLYWNDTAPTASAVILGTGAFNNVNINNQSYVMYLFASCPGVSKVGSYTGTGTTKQIDCGFTGGARFVLIKRTDSTGDWYVWDSARGIVAGNDPYLLLNSTAAEVTNTDYVDAYAAGFEISSTAPAAINASGGSYIYLAIA